jgi:hypothetical protein
MLTPKNDCTDLALKALASNALAFRGKIDIVHARPVRLCKRDRVLEIDGN